MHYLLSSHIRKLITPKSRLVISGVLACAWGGLAAQQQPATTTQPGVDAIVSMRNLARKTPGTSQKAYTVSVSSTAWVDTGAEVAAGQVIQVTAKGSLTLADGRVAEPAGVARGWKDLLRNFPLNAAPVGALIGRVTDLEASVPFLVDPHGKVTMPTSGRLYLRMNASHDLEATGLFDVKLKLEDAPKATSAVDTNRSPAVSQLIGPSLFAGIPRRVEDKAGHPGDMVNYALIGTEAQVVAAFKAAGWVAVDQSVQDAILHGLLATLGHEAYTAVPISTLYLFGRPQDLSFARGDPLKVAAERHHLRVWKTDQTIRGAPLWVGSATYDVGFETDQRNGDVTHKIDPKVDDERAFLLSNFDATGAFTSAAYVTPTDPLREGQTATGGSFFSDGRVLVMELK